MLLVCTLTATSKRHVEKGLTLFYARLFSVQSVKCEKDVTLKV